MSYDNSNVEESKAAFNVGLKSAEYLFGLTVEYDNKLYIGDFNGAWRTSLALGCGLSSYLSKEDITSLNKINDLKKKISSHISLLNKIKCIPLMKGYLNNTLHSELNELLSIYRILMHGNGLLNPENKQDWQLNLFN